MPTGITGLARPRQWDALIAVELPELAGETINELSFMAFDGEIVASAGGGFTTACERVAASLDGELARPYEVLLVRRGSTAWAAGARRVKAELITLGVLDARVLEVALTPDGELSAALDEGPIEGLVDPVVDIALRELERRGRARFQAFAARADNVGGERWQLTIDPL